MGDKYTAAYVAVGHKAIEHRNALVEYIRVQKELDVAKRDMPDSDVVQTYTKNLQRAQAWVDRSLAEYSDAVRKEIEAVGT